MTQHLNIRVKGKVQGVYFRRDTQLQANKLGVLGMVVNQDDGSVYIEAEAEEAVLEAFVAWCGMGPELANVTQLLTTKGQLKGFTSFEVLAEPSDFLG